MSGIGLILDLARKNPRFSCESVHLCGLFSAKVAAASFAAGAIFPSRNLFGVGSKSVAYCDAGAPLPEDLISSIRTATANIFQREYPSYITKHYHVELKPLFSAFQLRNFTLTTLRSFLLFYLPLLGPRLDVDEDRDDDDSPLALSEEQHVDLITPFKKSVKLIIRETSVVTTRRVLERVAIHYFSERMAWKLLKDVPRSAVRKAGRKMPIYVYFSSVSRTTFRGHFLGVAASWVFQVGLEVYRFFSGIFSSNDEELEEVDKFERIQILGRKIYGTTIRCGASLVFASIGAGIGATIYRPSSGQSIGCLIGDLAGPVVVSYCFERLHFNL